MRVFWAWPTPLTLVRYIARSCCTSWILGTGNACNIENVGWPGDRATGKLDEIASI